ncbi:GGDEF domain-containing protein [Oceanisphaera avium]|uniref:diguanylate cyclase n=1 Tax=Oceanisphaera avium TaxID=1903694 RepID=A0A1Y0CYT2_9GAMM|nr:sensor domain-containing diguanylate cyclase [Oceanisphaera avium]ART80174.1 GGDEF domain-containing protein [Oceanisphaera avium]
MNNAVLEDDYADHEELRLAALAAYDILDTPPEAAFDAITEIAALICDAPIAVINFIDRDRQWFKSVLGLDVRQTPLNISICVHAITQPDLFIVPDTRLDARFTDNPLVRGEPYLRFYAGALLRSETGYPIGTLCVLDYQPRELNEKQLSALTALAGQVMTQLELLRAHSKQASLIQELQAAQAELLALASTDSLSGLLNRRAFEECLENELLRLKRNEQSAALIMIDFDHFKSINDQFGHAAGDCVIRNFAELCHQVFRQTDVISRWGGEEFVVLLPNTSQAQALEAAERLQQLLKNQPILELKQQAIFMTVSIGISTLTASCELEASLRGVDQLLYLAKAQGRNCTVCA